MQSDLLGSIGVDPAYICILLFVIEIALVVFLTDLSIKYKKMHQNYVAFMKGRDGKSLEKSMLEQFKELTEVSELAKANKKTLVDLNKKVHACYQKLGLVRYDAFQEMGGNLSFAISLLDEEDNGWILNAMHSREGCYTYMKEIIHGQSYLELSKEETEALERAMYQELYETTVKKKKRSKRK
jgi:hypothetical protein